jgi:hypothetical protein
MRDHERAMLAYAMLSVLSLQRGQYLSRDKFLILTAAAACRAGWPDVSNRCHTLVLANNPLHLLGNYDLFTDAMRSPDFEPFLKQLERFCGYEKAEHLLSELGLEPVVPESEAEMTPGNYVLKIIADGP